MNKRYDLILFDFDDTLFDYEKTEERALRDSMLYHGLIYEDNYYAIFKKINRELWAYHNINNSQNDVGKENNKNKEVEQN